MVITVVNVYKGRYDFVYGGGVCVCWGEGYRDHKETETNRYKK